MAHLFTERTQQYPRPAGWCLQTHRTIKHDRVAGHKWQRFSSDSTRSRCPVAAAVLRFIRIHLWVIRDGSLYAERIMAIHALFGEFGSKSSGTEYATSSLLVLTQTTQDF